jgi:hypothetical protein
MFVRNGGVGQHFFPAHKENMEMTDRAPVVFKDDKVTEDGNSEGDSGSAAREIGAMPAAFRSAIADMLYARLVFVTWAARVISDLYT